MAKKTTTRKKNAGTNRVPGGQAQSAAEIFMSLVDHYSYQQGPTLRTKGLTNFTFFAGAGFSKAWDPAAPIGSELFTIKPDVIEKVADVGALARMFGLSTLDDIEPEMLRQIVYQIDMYERYPDVRSRYIDDQNLRMFRGALRAAVVDRYDKITNLNYFDTAIEKFPLTDPTDAQSDILAFFRHLHARIDGSQGPADGIRTQFVTTNYDYVIETILDNVLNPDDTLFLYTYRGFTPVRVVDEPNMAPVHEHWLVQHLLKINGGFEILRKGDDYILDYSRRSPAQIIADPPILMLASREQDYSDPYFKTVFPKVVRLMRDTAVLVIVGYSLPADDALIRFFIRQFAEEPEDGRGKVVFYIGPGTDEQKRSVLEEVFPSMERENAPMLITHNGGFDEFAAECLLYADTTFN
ncbi:SIR2 family protein [Rhizobium leguminosarum]|uniref:SIR2 family protein n=1 Tax=Rhizobium leguminosarum TaxID=384 RepID=UPI0013F1737F|nr:SIR2 family protein [Rhizobium leguminosarum]